jgi:integrase
VTLYRRGRIYWAYVWINGVRHAKSTRSSNRRQAEIIGQKFKDELNLRRHHLTQLQPEMRFAELVARFLSEADVKPYHLDRLKVLLPFFENLAIGEITKGVARRFRQERKRQRQLVLSGGKHPKPAKPLTETTLNRDLECLRHILYWAVDEGYLVANPLSRMRLERERKRKRPVLSVGEEELLLAAAAPHLRQIVTVALDAGMRRGEILTQRWEDVDFTRGLLFPSHSKTPEGEFREIPLTARLLNLLSEMKKSEGLIFTFEGKPLRSIKTAWKAAIRRAGIRYLSFHRTRHTFNTRLMEAGVMREVRMSLMGHSLGDDPQADYTHVELPAKREAIRKLELWRAAQEKQSHDQKQMKGDVPG